jgi:hypothetical protein
MSVVGNQQGNNKRPGNIVLQERDKVVLQWLSRVGLASSEQIADMFGYSEAPLLRRLQKLRQAGYAGGRKIDAARPVVFWSKIGYFDLPVRQPPPGTFEHDYALTGLYIWLRRQHPEAIITTDRELRRYQGVGRLIGERGKRPHLPDGIVQLGSERIAVELENSVKPKDRLQSILRQYYADRCIDQVWYFATTVGVQNLIARNAVTGKIRLFSYPGGTEIPIGDRLEEATDRPGQASMYDFGLAKGGASIDR